MVWDEFSSICRWILDSTYLNAGIYRFWTVPFVAGNMDKVDKCTNKPVNSGLLALSPSCPFWI